MRPQPVFCHLIAASVLHDASTCSREIAYKLSQRLHRTVEQHCEATRHLWSRQYLWHAAR